MSEQLRKQIARYREDYLETPEGQKHLAVAESEAEEVKQVFEKLWSSYQAGEDITEGVLNQLLPHADTAYHRENDYRISTWPCITKDVRKWFEGAGWKTPDQWPDTARLILEAIHGLITGDLEAWYAFVNSPLRHGFGTGFISPILFCLDPQYPVINSKVEKTYRYCTTQLGAPDQIDASLANYLDNRSKVLSLQKQLEEYGLSTILEFDLFCHYAVSKRLGGGDLTKARSDDVASEAAAWLFVANPEIFEWETAFVQGGVDWKGSKGAYAQKLIREGIRPGDRAIGYQAGPVYAVQCELRVQAPSYKTSDGSWAVDLEPVRRFENPVSLSTLKEHPVLSQLKFVQQTQMSISGISAEQLAALDALLDAEEVPAIEVIGKVDKLCTELEEAQFDTRNPDRFEIALADGFEFLGFETEHIGGPGKADVLLQAMLGADSYTVVADAKTCQKGSTLSSPNYQPINDHKEQNTADFAVFVAPAYAGGNTIAHAEKAGVSLLTTDTLINLIRWHDQIPFTLYDLRRLFEKPGLEDRVSDELRRGHVRHSDLFELALQVAQIFEDMQRQDETSSPLQPQAIQLVMKYQLGQSGPQVHRAQDIKSILELLSNDLFGILEEQSGGYVLTLPVGAAAKRIAALASALAVTD